MSTTTAPVISEEKQSKPQIDKTAPKLWTIAIIAVVTVAVLGTGLCSAVGMKLTSDLGQVGTVLSVLSFVALLVERVTEVFVSIWRDPSSDLLEQRRDYYLGREQVLRTEIEELNKELTQENPGNDRRDEIAKEKDDYRAKIRDGIEQIGKIDEDLVAYKAKTRRLATGIAIGIGVIAGGAGFRLLQSFVDLSSPAAWQKQVFYGVDVLLTGTLLAGGSLLVHQLFALYDVVMQTSQNRVKGEKSRSP